MSVSFNDTRWTISDDRVKDICVSRINNDNWEKDNKLFTTQLNIQMKDGNNYVLKLSDHRPELVVKIANDFLNSLK